MENFKKILIQEAIEIPEDDFEHYNYSILVPASMNHTVKVWLYNLIFKYEEDEFISDALRDIIGAFENGRSYEAGLNFLYNGNKYSIYVADRNIFYITSEKKIIENIINQIMV